MQAFTDVKMELFVREERMALLREEPLVNIIALENHLPAQAASRAG